MSLPSKPTSMKRRGLDLGPVHAEGDLVVAVGAAGHVQRQMIEDALAEAVHVGEAMGGGEIDAGLPFLGASIRCGWWGRP